MLCYNIYKVGGFMKEQELEKYVKNIKKVQNQKKDY